MQADEFLSKLVCGDPSELEHLRRVLGVLQSKRDHGPMMVVFMGYNGCGKEKLVEMLNAKPVNALGATKAKPGELVYCYDYKVLRAPFAKKVREHRKLVTINPNSGFKVPGFDANDAVTRSLVQVVHLWNAEPVTDDVQVPSGGFPYVGPVLSDCATAPEIQDPYRLMEFIASHCTVTGYVGDEVRLLDFHEQYKAFCSQVKHPPLRIHSMPKTIKDLKMQLGIKRNYARNANMVTGLRFNDGVSVEAVPVEEKPQADVLKFVTDNFEVTGNEDDAVSAVSLTKAYGDYCKANELAPGKLANLRGNVIAAFGVKVEWKRVRDHRQEATVACGLRPIENDLTRTHFSASFSARQVSVFGDRIAAKSSRKTVAGSSLPQRERPTLRGSFGALGGGSRSKSSRQQANNPMSKKTGST